MRPDNLIGVPFTELSEVDSSNNYAMRKVQAQLAEHGATWFAHYQKSGKGQRGKRWNAEQGQNIMISFVLDTSAVLIDKQAIISMAVALACYDFFNKYAIDSSSIKWPNDIYWRDRKAGGILIEAVTRGQECRYAVVGIGLNINQTLFPANLKNPVSLRQITGKSYDVILMAKELCNMLELRWQQLRNDGEHALHKEYNSRLYKINQPATFKTGTTTIQAVVEGVNLQGELLINTGQQAAVSFGSVEWVIA